MRVAVVLALWGLMGGVASAGEKEAPPKKEKKQEKPAPKEGDRKASRD